MTSNEIDENISIRYDFKRKLGKGAYGIVWKAIDLKSNAVVAVKKIFDAFRNKTDAQRTYREIMFLKEFEGHPNIIELIKIHKAKNNKDIYLVFEYMDIDLHHAIKKENVLKNIHKSYIMYQLFKAVNYIHSGRVIHRDLKPSNILLDIDCRCKLADFGLARTIGQSSMRMNGAGEGSDPRLTEYVATRWYRAPEIILSSKNRRYTEGIDMWSLGCILAEMLLGKPLFPGNSTSNQIEKILSTISSPPFEELIQDLACDSGLVASIKKTSYKPNKSLRDILRHAPRTAVDLVERLLIFNPLRRLSASAALQHPYVARFREKGDDIIMKNDIVLILRDDMRLAVDLYRNKLYELIKCQTYKKKTTSIEDMKKVSKEEMSKSTINLTKKKNFMNFFEPNRKSRNLRKESCPDSNFKKDEKTTIYSRHPTSYLISRQLSSQQNLTCSGNGCTGFHKTHYAHSTDNSHNNFKSHNINWGQHRGSQKTEHKKYKSKVFTSISDAHL